MANSGFKYGLSAEVARKIAGKRDPKEEEKAKVWIETITGDSFDSSMSFEDNLKDGRRLCRLINALKPKSVKDISDSSSNFKRMENINKFLTGIEKYGVPVGDLFQTVDLFEASNIPTVTATIFALGRVCHGKEEFDESSPNYKGWPTLGPKPSTANKREFDEETLREGKKIIGIQAGTNKLASQSGQSFGGRRQVNK